MLVVLEGLDGAGKSTQVKKLRTYLESLFGSLEYVHFPRYDAPVYGDLISRFLRGDFGSNETVHPQLVALLFAEDRHGAAPAMKKVLEDGGTVLLDRYVYSNIAYQCAKLADEGEKQSLSRWILDFEFRRNALPVPDRTLFLSVPLEFIKKNLSETRTGDDRDYLNGKEDIHEKSITLQENVYKEYLKLLNERDDFAKVDCFDAEGRFLPKEEIHEKIWKLLTE